MTPEELRAIQEAGSLDELVELLQAYLTAGKISQEEAASLYNEFGLPLEDAGDVLTIPTAAQPVTPATSRPAGEGFLAYKTLSNLPRELFRAVGLRGNTLEATPEEFRNQPFDTARLAELIASTQRKPKAAPPVSPVDQYLNDPDIKAYLSSYTSESDKTDPTSLAQLIANLLAQGILPDEATAGAIYNRILGKTSLELDAARQALDVLKGYEGEYAATPEQLADAQRRVDKALATLDQPARMVIRAGTARGETAAAKREADVAKGEATRRAKRIADINYVNKLNAGVQADYEEELAKAEQASLNAPRIEAAKREYLPSLRIALDNGVKAGTLTQEQADQQFDYESSLIDRGFDLKDLPNYQQAVTEAQNTELGRLIDLSQINLAPKIKEADRQASLQELFGRSEKAGLERLLKERQFQASQPELPPQPSYASVYEPFLAGIGAPNFRRFVESRLGRIAEETEGARAAWWRARNPEQPMPDIEPATPTFESLLAGARADVRERGDILAAVGTPVGVGEEQRDYLTTQAGLSETRLADLLALGQEGYFAQQGAIPKAEPVAPRTPTTAPDPFKTAIKAYPFLEKFMELSPGERGYQKQRFAPRVQYRF